MHSFLEWARTHNIIRPITSTKFFIEKQTIRTILNLSSESMKAHVKCITFVINFVNPVGTVKICFTLSHWDTFATFCMTCPKKPSWCIFLTPFETFPVFLKISLNMVSSMVCYYNLVVFRISTFNIIGPVTN